MIKLSRDFWTRFAALASPYWRSDEKWIAWGLLGSLILLMLGQVGSCVLFNQQSGEFTSALAAKDADRFWRSIYQCLAMLVVAVPIYALYYYVRDKLGIYWRRWLTIRLLRSHFNNRACYELNSNAKIDNPDQRIAEDVNTFTQKSLYFLLIIVGSLIQLVAFSSVLWAISRPLVYFLVMYAVVGTVTTMVLFGRVLIGLNFVQLKWEADLRFGLLRIRENAESIALYRGEDQELSQVKARFGDAFTNFNRLISWQLYLNNFQYAYSFLTIVIPSAIIASRVMAGELEVGRAIQAARAFTANLSGLAIMVDNVDTLSKFAVGVERLNTFVKFLDVESQERAAVQGIETAQGDIVELQNVTLHTRDDRRRIINNLSLDICP